MTAAMTAHRAQLDQELRDEEAARRWSEGKLNVQRLRGMAVAIPGVTRIVTHQWAGYPTWEELTELARLCNIEPLWFFTQD